MLKRLPQQVVLVVNHRPEIDPLVRELGHGAHRRGRQVALRHQPVRADQQRVAGKGGEALVGAVAVTGRPQRQYLPQRLLALGQEVKKAVGCFAQVADAVAAGKRGGV
jgi:hypothetical protein